MLAPWSYDINGRTWTNADFDGYLYIKNRPALIGDLLAQTTAGPTSTSTSSITIGTGSKSFTIGTGVPFKVGAQVRISRQSDSAVWMNGVITVYNNVTGAITVNVEDVNGSGGPFTDWNIQLSGKTGAGGSGVQNKFDATADPTPSDDTGAGYGVGSLWVRTDEPIAWICTDATSSAAVWEIIIGGRQRVVHLWDEFTIAYSYNQYGLLPWLKVASGAGAQVWGSNIKATERKSLGDVQADTGTTATGYAGAVLGHKHNFDTNGGYSIEMEFNGVSHSALSTVTDEYIMSVGLVGGSTYATANTFIGFVYDRLADGDFWTCITENGGTQEKTVTAIAPVAYDSSPYGRKLNFLVNEAGTQVQFFIDGALVATHTTNIPYSGVNGILRPCYAIEKSAGTTSLVMFISRFDIWLKFSSRY